MFGAIKSVAPCRPLPLSGRRPSCVVGRAQRAPVNQRLSA